MSAKKVVVAMSGGVDSSLTAAILLEKGYEVIGINLRLWSSEDEDVLDNLGGCCSLTSTGDARRVADKLGFPFYVFNFEDIFKSKVIDYFCGEYVKGRTPNPCIMCNQEIKFAALLERARAIGAEYMATGHYAKIEYSDKHGRYVIKKAVDDTKDQTYALYPLTQDQLAHTLFPLGDYRKEEIRELGRSLKLPVADKPDSQEICFIPDNDYKRYLSENLSQIPGPGKFIDTEGKVLGTHSGIMNYTIGQRKGLGLSAPDPLYVVDIRPEDNVVVLGSGDKVYASALIASQLNLISVAEIAAPMEVEAKIRYNAHPAPATVIPMGGGKVKVQFREKQRAITPGQAVVFYQDDVVVGGGTIENRLV